MKRKFKSLAEAKAYFENYDTNSLHTRSQFFVIDELAKKAFESDNQTTEDLRFWMELQFRAADQSRMIMQASYRPEYFEFLAEKLTERTGDVLMALNMLLEIFRLSELPEPALIGLLVNSGKHYRNKNFSKVFNRAGKELLKRNLKLLSSQLLAKVITSCFLTLRTKVGKKLFEQAGEELLQRDLSVLPKQYLKVLQDVTEVVIYHPTAEKLYKRVVSARLKKCRYLN